MFIRGTCISDGEYVISDPIIVHFTVTALRGLLKRSIFVLLWESLMD